jgi:Holliday junction resolvase
MPRKARVDANQQEIVSAFRKCGFSVTHLHSIGKGVPDLLVAKNGHTALVEVKDGNKPPSARKLTDDQERFIGKWRGVVHIVATVDDVLRIAGEAA